MESLRFVLVEFWFTRFGEIVSMLARTLSALWLAAAVALAVELAIHLVNGTSETRSQGFRLVFIGLYLLSASALWYRYRHWKFAVAVPSALVAVREYVVLAVPMDIDWNFFYLQSLAILILAVSSFAVVWIRAPTKPSAPT